jgi:hypothetical protein
MMLRTAFGVYPAALQALVCLVCSSLVPHVLLAFDSVDELWVAMSGRMVRRHWSHHATRPAWSTTHLCPPAFVWIWSSPVWNAVSLLSFAPAHVGAVCFTSTVFPWLRSFSFLAPRIRVALKTRPQPQSWQRVGAKRTPAQVTQPPCAVLCSATYCACTALSRRSQDATDPAHLLLTRVCSGLCTSTQRCCQNRRMERCCREVFFTLALQRSQV